MFSAFTRRAPWAAGLISLVFGPTIGMFYLNRWRVGVAYLLAPELIAAAILVAMHFEFLSTGFGEVFWPAAVLLNLAGAIHCVIAAARMRFSNPRWYARWYSLTAFLVALLLTALLMRVFVLEPFTVPAVSMSPAVNPGDYIFVSKLPSQTIERGDIVAHYLPGTDLGGIVYIERVIGMPGDTIQYRSGRLYIDGVIAEREQDGIFSLSTPWSESNVPMYRETLPEGRSYRILEVSDEGMADDTVVYEVPPDHYFMLGDNRDDARDSRFFGAVPEENVLGRVVITLWDGRTDKFVVRRFRQ